jgi:uncharacterized membrane protein
MKLSLKKELPIIVVVLLPFIYLAYIWNELPQGGVPIHWNIKGEIDGYGSKGLLILVPIVLPLLVYIIFLFPRIVPKNKLNQIGNNFQNIKIFVTIFMSALALLIIYSSKNQTITNPNYVILGLGILFVILGNYFKTIKPNYFLGIRTPWTLESDTIWKETHRMVGKMWLVGGIVILFASLILNEQANLIVFLIITAIITLVPIFYSYLRFKNR